MRHAPRWISFALFLALCASIAFWGLQLFKPAVRAVAAVPAAPTESIDLAAAATLFGGKSSAVAASNFQLQGVIDAQNGPNSVAILSANGKPAQAVRRGVEIAPGTTVTEVHRDYVLLSEGGIEKRVELPQQPAPSGALTDPNQPTNRPMAPAPQVTIPSLSVPNRPPDTMHSLPQAVPPANQDALAVPRIPSDLVARDPAGQKAPSDVTQAH